VALNAYIQQTQRLLHDPTASFYNAADLTTYINIARRQLAIEGQCVRALLSGGTILSVGVNSGGSGYAGTPSVTITGSGQQAKASAQIGGGQVTQITLLNGGWGYLTPPTFTVVGSGGGNNATFNVLVDNSCSTVAGQEVYPFSSFNSLVQSYPTLPGMQAMVGCFGVSISWGSMKPTLKAEVWSEFQAWYRSYNTGLQNYPMVWSSYGKGVAGSIYLWPLPSQVSQMDVDAWCIPIDLISDSTPEAIPSPWTDCIPYYAAYLAYDNAQRKQDADRMLAAYTQFMKRAQALTEAPFTVSYYAGL
jgi:hypothetical protein